MKHGSLAPNSTNYSKSILGRIPFLLLAVVFISRWPHAQGQTASTAFTHFEARQTHSIALTPDGSRLLALNSPAGSLAVFEVSTTSANPIRLAEIPVGVEPVAVRARTNDEVWVVNEVSDSVSIVSLSQKVVVATLPASDEPSDVVFAQGKAFVSCARNRLLRVFDAITRAELSSIELNGLDPRALATDAAGNFVFAAFLLSGNQTTILSRLDAPPQPAPTNPDLPEAPNTGLIVAADDPRIGHSVLDRDVAMINASTGQVVSYYSGAGTVLFDLAVQPGSGALWVANTEARNLIRFEPVLRGHFVDHRLTRIEQGSGTATIYDLNAGIDYGTLPNPSARATALAQPTGVLFDRNGSLWTAAFATDRVAKGDPATGAVVARIDLRTGGGDASVMRGPRALALHPTESRLYVLNKISDTISVVDTDTNELLTEVSIAALDWMPAEVRAGRGFLFDARVSGNGTASCAACHVDADRDGLAWDLGDPNGSMSTVMGANLSAHDFVQKPRPMHPMKGPMVTQTLRGMTNGAPFHWRGDRPTLQSFNPTFDRLMGGSQLNAQNIDAMAEYLLTLRHHPNPNRTKAGTLPSSMSGGRLPGRGEQLFNLHDNHCGICHLGSKGTDNNIDLHQEVGASQPIKNPSLATVYQRLSFDSRAGAQSLSGFGLLHDGTGFVLPTVHPYVLDVLKPPFDFGDVEAFVMCFETGTSNAVGDSITLTAQTASAAAFDLNRLESMLPANGSLVVTGMIGGTPQRWIYSRARQLYVSTDLTAPPIARAELLTKLQGNDVLTFRGVQPYEGSRFAGEAPRPAEATRDSYFVANAKQPLNVSTANGVMANDSNVATSHDLAEVVLSTTLGQTALNLDGSFVYTPGISFAKTGRDTFTYRVLIGSDPGNPTSTVEATVNTMASAAGTYTGHLRTTTSNAISGFVKITVSGRGAWSGSIKVGSKTVSAKGTIAVDGKLIVPRQPAFNVALRLSALSDGKRQIAGQILHDGNSSTGLLPGNPYSSKSKAPAAGKHKLTLTVASSTGTAPLNPGSATLTVGKTGTASISGKFGDNTGFSASGVLSPVTGGGWRFMIYTAVYKYPAGQAAGEVAFDPATPLLVGGTLQVVKPPQTRSTPFQAGFTIDYTVAKTAM